MVDSSLTHTFTFDFYSEASERRYTGAFTTKKLSIKDMTLVGVRKVQLSGGMSFNPLQPGQGIDFATFQINGMIAHLEVALTETPKWFNLDELIDIEIMSKVFEEVIAFENNFPARGSNAGEGGRERRGEGSGEAQESGSDRPGNDPQVVAGEVQASLEP
jgi:hypothetical protein